MEIKLPESKAYLEKLLTGELATLRIPNGPIRPGSVITAWRPGIPSQKILLGVKEAGTVRLYSITETEAEQEGYTVPDFCPSRAVCANIDSRLDPDSAVFEQAGDAPVCRSPDELEDELSKRLAEGCRSCPLKKNAKDLFLSWQRSAYGMKEDTNILKVTVEVLSKR